MTSRPCMKRLHANVTGGVLYILNNNINNIYLSHLETVYPSETLAPAWLEIKDKNCNFDILTL